MFYNLYFLRTITALGADIGTIGLTDAGTTGLVVVGVGADTAGVVIDFSVDFLTEED